MEWLVPIIWLLLAVLFIIVEVSTFNLVSIWFAIGAASAMFVSIADPQHDNFVLQGVVFVVVSAIALVIIRNWSLKKLKAGAIKTNVNSLIGKTAVVTKKIEAYNVGEVKVDGLYWSAKAQSPDIIIDQGLIVEIIEVSGVKLIVKKTNKGE